MTNTLTCVLVLLFAAALSYAAGDGEMTSTLPCGASVVIDVGGDVASALAGVSTFRYQLNCSATQPDVTLFVPLLALRVANSNSTNVTIVLETYAPFRSIAVECQNGSVATLAPSTSDYVLGSDATGVFTSVEVRVVAAPPLDMPVASSGIPALISLTSRVSRADNRLQRFTIVVSTPWNLTSSSGLPLIASSFLPSTTLAFEVSDVQCVFIGFPSVVSLTLDAASNNDSFGKSVALVVGGSMGSLSVSSLRTTSAFVALAGSGARLTLEVRDGANASFSSAAFGVLPMNATSGSADCAFWRYRIVVANHSLLLVQNIALLQGNGGDVACAHISALGNSTISLTFSSLLRTTASIRQSVLSLSDQSILLSDQPTDILKCSEALQGFQLLVQGNSTVLGSGSLLDNSDNKNVANAVEGVVIVVQNLSTLSWSRYYIIDSSQVVRNVSLSVMEGSTLVTTHSFINAAVVDDVRITVGNMSNVSHIGCNFIYGAATISNVSLSIGDRSLVFSTLNALLYGLSVLDVTVHASSSTLLLSSSSLAKAAYLNRFSLCLESGSVASGVGSSTFLDHNVVTLNSSAPPPVLANICVAVLSASTLASHGTHFIASSYNIRQLSILVNGSNSFLLVANNSFLYLGSASYFSNFSDSKFVVSFGAILVASTPLRFVIYLFDVYNGAVSNMSITIGPFGCFLSADTYTLIDSLGPVQGLTVEVTNNSMWYVERRIGNVTAQVTGSGMIVRTEADIFNITLTVNHHSTMSVNNEGRAVFVVQSLDTILVVINRDSTFLLGTNSSLISCSTRARNVSLVVSGRSVWNSTKRQGSIVTTYGNLSVAVVTIRDSSRFLSELGTNINDDYAQFYSSSAGVQSVWVNVADFSEMQVGVLAYGKKNVSNITVNVAKRSALIIGGAGMVASSVPYSEGQLLIAGSQIYTMFQVAVSVVEGSSLVAAAAIFSITPPNATIAAVATNLSLFVSCGSLLGLSWSVFVCGYVGMNYITTRNEMGACVVSNISLQVVRSSMVAVLSRGNYGEQAVLPGWFVSSAPCKNSASNATLLFAVVSSSNSQFKVFNSTLLMVSAGEEAPTIDTLTRVAAPNASKPVTWPNSSFNTLSRCRLDVVLSNTQRSTLMWVNESLPLAPPNRSSLPYKRLVTVLEAGIVEMDDVIGVDWNYIIRGRRSDGLSLPSTPLLPASFASQGASCTVACTAVVEVATSIDGESCRISGRMLSTRTKRISHEIIATGIVTNTATTTSSESIIVASATTSNGTLRLTRTFTRSFSMSNDIPRTHSTRVSATETISVVLSSLSKDLTASGVSLTLTLSPSKLSFQISSSLTHQLPVTPLLSMSQATALAMLSGIVSGAVGTTASNAMRAALSTSLASCDSVSLDNSFEGNYLNIHFGADSGADVRGAAVGSIAIIVFSFILCAGFMQLLGVLCIPRDVRQFDSNEGESLDSNDDDDDEAFTIKRRHFSSQIVSFPGWIIVPVAFVCQPLVGSCVALIVGFINGSLSDATDLALGVVGLAMLVVVLGIILHRVSLHNFTESVWTLLLHAEADRRDVSSYRRLWLWLITPTGHWDDAVHGSGFTGRYFPVFRSYCGGRQWYQYVEVTLGASSGVVQAFAVNSPEGCERSIFALGSIQIVAMGCVALLRPYAIMWELLIIGACCVCGAVYGVLVMVSPASCPQCLAVSSSFASAQLYLTVCSAVLSFIYFLARVALLLPTLVAMFKKVRTLRAQQHSTRSMAEQILQVQSSLHHIEWNPKRLEKEFTQIFDFDSHVTSVHCDVAPAEPSAIKRPIPSTFAPYSPIQKFRYVRGSLIDDVDPFLLFDISNELADLGLCTPPGVDGDASTAVEGESLLAQALVSQYQQAVLEKIIQSIVNRKHKSSRVQRVIEL